MELTTSTPVDGIRWDCGDEVDPGNDEVSEWRDWSERESTEDQQRIERFLKTLRLDGTRFLHVGIGNSAFARTFCAAAALVDGITIQPGEIERAARLPGYRTFLVNKFAMDLPAVLPRRYDFIIDNNPSSYACCRKHFLTMMSSYTRLLAPEGSILTDLHGLWWVSTGNDVRWRLSPKTWFQIGSLFDLEGITHDETVLGLRRPASAMGSSA